MHCRLWYGNLQQQVGRVLDIVLESARDPVVRETVVERHVELRRLLPLEIRARSTDRRHPDRLLISEGVAIAVTGRQLEQGCVGRYGLTTQDAVAGTQAQLRKQPTLHEVLFADPPRRRHGRERRPLVVGCELGRPVPADHSGKEVAVLETVGEPAEEPDELIFRSEGAGGHELGAGGQIVKTERVGDEIAGLRRELVCLEVLPLVTAHDFDVVSVAEALGIGEEALERHVREVTTPLFCTPVKLRPDRTGQG